MKNGQFIILAGIAIVAALAFFDTFRKEQTEKSPESLIPHEEQQEIKDALTKFQAGLADFKNSEPADKACASYSGSSQAVCLNGYFVAANMANIKNQASKDLNGLDAKVPAVGKNPTLTGGLWYSSLGTALAQLNVAPKTIEKYIKNKSMWPNVVDGWAFGELQKSGFQGTLDACTAEYQKKDLRACYFGMGRATFFSRRDLEAGHTFPKELIAGFLYTKFLLQPAPEHPTAASFVAKMDLAGAVTQWMWTDDKKDLEGFKEMHQCLSQRHPVECD